MRVAMISEHASPLAVLGSEYAGGQNAHVADLSAALADQGHDIRVYTRRDSPALPDSVPMRACVNVVHVPSGPPESIGKDSLLPHMRGFGRWLVEQWRAGDWAPDVAHAHFWMSGIAALTAGRCVGVPVVQTFHALGTVERRYHGSADQSPPQRIRCEQALGPAVDHVVAQCRDEVRELVRMGVLRTHTAIVPSGVDSEKFRPDGQVTARDPRRPRILTVGRFVARKGFHDVIKALRRVPEAECVVVGGPPAAQLDSDPFAAELWEVARSSRVADRVRLVGAVPRSEMPQWYRSADVVALAPWYEPFGLVPLEAMACGVPVVATAVGGLTDAVVAGVTGDLVPPREPRTLGLALRRLFDEPARRIGYGIAGLDRARRCYSWRRAAVQLGAVYAKAGAGQPVSGRVA